MTATEQSRAGKAILLVEDDNLVRSSIRPMLAADDYQVIEAHDAAEAIGTWQERNHEIELLMTDIRMPGMTGIDLVSCLRERECKLKALYISGYPEMLHEAKPVACAMPFLQKPFTFEQVSSKLRTILNRPLHGWKCPRCSSRHYRGLTADNDGHSWILTYTCADCELKRITGIEHADSFERCPFCAGPIVPSGHSYVGEKGYNLGSACYTCKATMRNYTPECAVIPW
jgi:YesN/AraC family two-component response regulator